MARQLIKDTFWVRRAFVVSDDDLSADLATKRYRSTAHLKFTDTTPGGNWAINPLPQFCRFTDPRPPGVLSENMKDDDNGRNGRGMGHYYSEAFDDNQQTINLRFGVAHFNSLTTFFAGFYNSDAAMLARTGRGGGIMYTLGKGLGMVVNVLSWKMLAVGLVGAGARWALEKPASKFYYLKPTMPLYWNAVTTIVNQIAVNAGIVPRVGGKDQIGLNQGYEFTKSDREKLHKLLPDVFREDGSIDVKSIAGRAQRLYTKRADLIKEEMNKVSNETLTQRINRVMTNNGNGFLDNDPNVAKADKEQGIDGYLMNWLNMSYSKVSDAFSKQAGAEAIEVDESGYPKEDPGVSDYFWNEMHDGSMFLTLRVNATGQVSESFSNATGPSDLQQKINGMSSSNRNLRFSFGDGKFDDGIIGKAVGGVISGVGDLVKGVADSLSISGLMVLAGNAFVDIPKHWMESSANLPRGNYSIDLIPTYGDPISRLVDMYLPLACLLAGVLPIATGKQTHTSPYLCQLFDQGRCQSRLAIIDSMTITRGITNLGFTNDGKVMGIRVDFSVTDLSSLIAMPITEGFSLGKAVKTAAAVGAGATLGTSAGGVGGGVAGAAAGGIAAAIMTGYFDDDNTFTDYMNVLAGMNLYDQIYSIPRAKLALTRMGQDVQSWKSASNIAQFMGDVLPARLMSAFFTGTVRN